MSAEARAIVAGNVREPFRSERFPDVVSCKHIREMNDRQRQIGFLNRKPKCVPIEGETGGIDDDGVRGVLALLQPIDDRSFTVRLEMFNLNAERFGMSIDIGLQLGQRLRAVILLRTSTQPVHVGSLQYQNSKSHLSLPHSLRVAS